jgi:hypothetical protein
MMMAVILNKEECGRTTSVIGWCPLENVLKIRKIGMTKDLSQFYHK